MIIEMGKIGDDEFGDMICSILKNYGVADGMIHSKEQSTSYSVVLAIPGIGSGCKDHDGIDSLRNRSHESRCS